MKLAELQLALHEVDPAAVLVSPQVMEKVIQQVCNLPTVPWDVPHRTSYVVDRQDLFRHIEQEDLNLNPEHLLPTTVILLLRPTSDRLTGAGRDNILGEYWRRLFHASIHLRLEQLCKEGELTLDTIRGRVEEIGHAEFQEVRKILVEDRYLPAGAGEEMTYIEFAAVFLELRYFAANLLPIYFPGLRDRTAHKPGAPATGHPVAGAPGLCGSFAAVEQVVDRDLDAAALFARTRLPGATDPVLLTDTSSDESHDYYWKLIRGAERAEESGNTVRAAMLRTRAARVAPANLTRSTRAEAEADIHRLALRLETALELSKSEAAEWPKDLNSLLDKADQGTRPVEADLLFDLQKVCLDSEQGIYTLSLVDWALSLGRRPIRRPLPSQRQVRLIKHLRSAGQRLTMARLSDTDRQHLSGLIQSALRQSEDRLRTRFRPILEVALQDVGLEPANPPERTAFFKIIEEVLDNIVAKGYLTFGDLRDIISRNQLKLPDLPNPKDFVRGDPLLRLDRRLGALLDGVYRPSEVYSRVLERLTALNFGTPLGRLLTTWVTLPFVGAFLLLKAVQHILIEPLQFLFFKYWEVRPSNLEEQPLPTEDPNFPVAFWSLYFLLAFWVLGLWHSQKVRARSAQTGHAVLEWLRWLFIDGPLHVARLPWLRRLVASWPFQLFHWCLFKPLLLCVLLRLLRPEWFQSWTWTGIIFVVTVLLVNSTFGYVTSELLNQVVVSLSEIISVRLFRGLLHLIAFLFKHTLSTIEGLFFQVDEWLRFRTGDNQFLLAVRVLLGLLWFPISYLFRFVLVVLVEPGINPLKLPVSVVAGKLMLPVVPSLTAGLIAVFTPVLGTWLAGVVGVALVFCLPDAFGYLFWELKENWGLYRANRSPIVRPVALGTHGETMLTLLEPGFHSGTVPRLFARWRNAEREAIKTGNWRVARTYRHAVEELQRTLRLFVRRNLVELVLESKAWQGLELSVGEVVLACSQIQIELVHPRFADQPVWLEFEEHEGWLVAVVRESGFLNELTPAELRPLNTALVSLYKLADVGLVREQMHAQLPPSITAYDVKAKELVLWLDHRYGRAASYSWNDDNGYLRPRRQAGQVLPDGPVLDALQFIFRRVPLYWEQWVECWQKDQDGAEHPHLVSAGVELDLLGLSRGKVAASVVAPEVEVNHKIVVASDQEALPAPAGPVALHSAITDTPGGRS